MRVLGTQRAKQLHSPAEEWLREQVLHTSYGSTLPGLAYFGVSVPVGGLSVDRVDALLFTPHALLVVAVREIPWYRGGNLFAPAGSAWTIEGIDAGFTCKGAANPGQGVSRAIYALREHLYAHDLDDGEADGGGLHGLVCVAGPQMKIRRNRQDRRTAEYLISTGDITEIRKAVARAERRVQARGARPWTRQRVLEVMDCLHLHYDAPTPLALVREGFGSEPGSEPVEIPEEELFEQIFDGPPLPTPTPTLFSVPAPEPEPEPESEPEPAPKRVDEVAGLRAAIRYRPSDSPLVVMALGLGVPAAVLVTLVVLLVQQVWDAVPSADAVAGIGQSPERKPGGMEFSKPSPEYRISGAQAAGECLALSTAAVHDQLAVKPCDNVTRTSYTATVDGRAIQVSVTTLGMPTTSAAQRVSYLIDSGDKGTVLNPGEAPGGPSGVVLDRRFAELTIARSHPADGAPIDQELLDRAAKESLP
ncbi:hypothetical protein D5S17_13565 [Pseudonocardiaceae bacterium YIM PH 21723]|nr:hypothetical protein D5S17_13565 [Pseudonocardiaceae bacterium YIM PH 21723]